MQKPATHGELPAPDRRDSLNAGPAVCDTCGWHQGQSEYLLLFFLFLDSSVAILTDIKG